MGGSYLLQKNGGGAVLRQAGSRYKLGIFVEGVFV